MKTSLRNLFLSAGLVAGFSAIAQPTITATGINPIVGDNFTSYSSATYNNPGSAGAGQTWTITSFSAATNSSSSCVTPGSTTHGSSFPSSNVASSVPSGTNTEVAYLKTSTTALQYDGAAIISGTTTIIMPYSNPEDFLHFPFTYTNSYTDTWATTFVQTNIVSTYTITNTTYRTGIDSITADGYGTLTTPAGTFGNVLRVHFVQNYKDSTITSGIGAPTTNLSSYRNNEYEWYLNNNHASLATVSTLNSVTSFTNSITYTSTYISGVVAGIDEQANIINSCNLFPNPAANSININLILTENQAVEVKLFNSLGAQVLASVNKEGMQGENNYKLDISTLPEGIYFVQLHLDGNLTSTRRFIVTK